MISQGKDGYYSNEMQASSPRFGRHRKGANLSGNLSGPELKRTERPSMGVFSVCLPEPNTAQIVLAEKICQSSPGPVDDKFRSGADAVSRGCQPACLFFRRRQFHDSSGVSMSTGAWFGKFSLLIFLILF